MQVHLLLEFLLTLIFISSMVILNFVIFKIPVKGNDKQIMIITLFVGVVNFYFKFIVGSPYFFLFQIVTYIIMIMVTRRYPIFYSIIVSLTGQIVVSLIDPIVSIPALRLKLTTLELINSNIIHFSVMHLIVSAITLIVAYLLHKFKIGFSLISRKYSGRYSINAINFIWGILLIAGIFATHFSTKAYTTYYLHPYIIAFILLCLLSSIVYAYYQNKIALQERYGDRKR